MKNLLENFSVTEDISIQILFKCNSAHKDFKCQNSNWFFDL